MDLGIYCEIMTEKGLDPYNKKDSNKNSFTEGEIALRKDLTSEKMVWTGKLWTDFWYFFMSEHAIFSWFCCPPFCGVPKEHPYSWKERICVLLIGLCWALTWKAAEIASLNDHDSDPDDFGTKGTEAITGLFVTIMTGINAYFATCSCVQGSKTRTRTICERVGCILITLNLLCALFFAIAMICYASVDGILDALIVAMIISNLYSWFGWDIFFCFIKFFIGWFGVCKIKKNYFKQRKMGRIESKLCVHWKDYAYYYDPKTKGNPQYLPQNDKIQHQLLSINSTTIQQAIQPIAMQQTAVVQQPIYIQQQQQQPVQAMQRVYIQQQQQPVYLQQQQPGQQAPIVYVQPPQSAQPVYLQQSGQHPTYYINGV